jgi:hypothetical protein
MGHWARECHSKPKKEQVHIALDEDEGSLLVTTTLTRPKVSSTPGSMVEVISSVAEIELKEEKVDAHLDEEKERYVGTLVLNTGVTNHMSGCQAAFTKLDMAVLGIGDDSVVPIDGRGTVMFMCKNSESQSLEGVYFIP